LLMISDCTIQLDMIAGPSQPGWGAARGVPCHNAALSVMKMMMLQ
jgi:hypothetical protein